MLMLIAFLLVTWQTDYGINSEHFPSVHNLKHTRTTIVKWIKFIEIWYLYHIIFKIISTFYINRLKWFSCRQLYLKEWFF